jgi:sugar phosphate isomerase/epimerase
MQIQKQPSTHLTYCLNVHPGETWDDNLKSLQTDVLAVRDRVSPQQPFGLGLRLSRRAAQSLIDEQTRAHFKAFLRDNNLYAFTINGFPYGAFHNTRVKEAVYQPDWRTPERVDYTLMLADILADLLPEGVSGSISTVPLAYRAAVSDDSERATMAISLGKVALAFDRLSKETGCELTLGLEPEPDCLIETTDEMIAFMEADMLQHARAHLVRQASISASKAETIIRRRIGLCLDTCHSAMQFEAPNESLRKAMAAGITISKIQVSAALKAFSPPVSQAHLQTFDDDVYLHQVRIRNANGTIERFPDLQPALAMIPSKDQANDSTQEWRIHCHVPLDFAGDGILGTTADDLTPAFFKQVLQSGVEHLEIETYTFGVLPESLRAVGMVNSIANEFEWVMGKVGIKS